MNQSDLTLIKEYYLPAIKSKWHAASQSFPDFLSEVSEESKKRNEQYLQAVSDDVMKQLNKFPRIPFRRKKWKKRTVCMVNTILQEESIVNLHNTLSQQTMDSFQKELTDFLIHVRKFAPELALDGIGQAVRNYIVYMMFKELNQVKSEFSMEGFGYSMLYPFTDNFIDNKNYSIEQKKEYNQIIRHYLNGENVFPTAPHQQKTCDLLFAATKSNDHQDSTLPALLLMMLEAQENSIQQQNKSLPLTMEERVDISLYKGGISVLIDRYYVEKEITKEDLFFYLSFGFFLQLTDDLQDIKEDFEQWNQTIFTFDKQKEQEEKNVNKMLHFIHQIIASYQTENHAFIDFILYNCYQLIYFSVIRNKDFFSEGYLKKLELYLPISCSFYEGLKEKHVENKKRFNADTYMNILDEMLFP